MDPWHSQAPRNDDHIYPSKLVGRCTQARLEQFEPHDHTEDEARGL